MKYYTPTKMSENIHETPEGFLICIGVPIARTGEMIYGKNETPLEADSTGQIRISRDASEVFHPDTIASFEGKPFTIGHPNEFVTPQNWKNLAKGVVQNVRKNPEKDEDGEQSLIADILVNDSFAINMIKNGLREVSCGYEAVYEQTGDGEGKQTNIIGNHLALVEQGRAGPSYAINDHKTERSKMSKFERLKSIFTKAVDEAEAAEKKDSKKDSKDEGAMPWGDQASYDELVKMVKDLTSKVDSMMPKDAKEDSKKDEEKDAKEGEEDKPKNEDKEDKDDESKDAPEDPSSLEDRLKAVEMAVSKLMENASTDAKNCDDDDEDAEEMGDAECTGDTASRAEILAPGIKLTKDVKAKALKTAYSTKEGKAVIDSLTGGRPVFDSAEKVNHLFIGASEILRAKRGTGLENSKNPGVFRDNKSNYNGPSVDELNARNKAFWSQK